MWQVVILLDGSQLNAKTHNICGCKYVDARGGKSRPNFTRNFIRVIRRWSQECNSLVTSAKLYGLENHHAEGEKRNTDRDAFLFTFRFNNNKSVTDLASCSMNIWRSERLSELLSLRLLATTSSFRTNRSTYRNHTNSKRFPYIYFCELDNLLGRLCCFIYFNLVWEFRFFALESWWQERSISLSSGWYIRHRVALMAFWLHKDA